MTDNRLGVAGGIDNQSQLSFKSCKRCRKKKELGICFEGNTGIFYVRSIFYIRKNTGIDKGKIFYFLNTGIFVCLIKIPVLISVYRYFFSKTGISNKLFILFLDEIINFANTGITDIPKYRY